MEYFTGIDLHKAYMLATTVDAAGNVVKQARLRNENDRVSAYFAALPGTHHAVVESGLGWYWLRDLLEQLSVDLVLAHALYVKAISYAKVKTDTVDSTTLAHLLRTGMIPAAHMISRERRPLRDLTRRRRRLVDEHTRMVNAQHGVLLAVHHSSHEQLEAIDRANHDALETICYAIERQTTAIDKTLHEALSSDRDYLLLLTIPGIGPIHAAEIALETDGIQRFASEKHYFSYCRVVPGASNSGTRISTKRCKQGNRYLRAAFGDAAVHAIALYPEFAERFRRLSRKKPESQARALIAKELARGVYHVLSNGEPYRGLKGRALSKRKASEPGILRKLEAVVTP